MVSKKEKFKEIIGGKFRGYKGNNNSSSGFVNLVQIKEEYFESWIDEFLKRIEKKLKEEKEEEFESELFERINDFIGKNVDKAGNIFFEKTRYQDKTHVQVFDQNNDVSLFWKTQDLYYVKNDIIRIEGDSVKEEINGVEYTFEFDASNAKEKNANEKLYVNYKIKKLSGRIAKFDASLDSTDKMSKTEIKRQVDKICAENIPIDSKKLRSIFNQFEKQITTDFFIHKDAKNFLTERWEEYFTGYVFDNKTKFEEKRINQLKILREFVLEFIDFISTFQDELVKIWEKKKFVTDSDYIITFDKIQNKGNKGKTVIKKIIKDTGFKKQKQEWEDLATCEKWKATNIKSDGSVKDEFKHLTIDTKHFPEKIKYEILSLFDDLDAELDGWLINSDNFQALNSLNEKFGGKIKCTYIDPPFNSEKSKTVYINSWEEAPWLTLIENRIEVGKQFLIPKKGVLIAAIDKNEQEVFGLLLKKLFPDYRTDCLTVIHNPKGTQTGGAFAFTHENSYVVYPNGLKFSKHKDPRLDNRKQIPINKWFESKAELIVHGTENGKHMMRSPTGKTFYGIQIKDDKIIGMKTVDANFHPKKKLEKLKDGSFILWPIDDVGEREWSLKPETLQERITNFGHEYFKIKKDASGDPDGIYRAQTAQEWKTVWGSTGKKEDGRYDAGTYGTKLLRGNMGLSLPNETNLFPKSVWTVYDSLHSVIKNDQEAYVLDYFGGGGTTAHATMLLNKKDDGKRKFILVEQGEYFESIILPRVKKSAFAVNVKNSEDGTKNSWKNGKPENDDGIGIFVKYFKFEQYEQVLSRTNLYTKKKPPKFTKAKDYAKYIFKNDEKNLPEKTQITLEKKDLESIYEKIDLAETLSCVKGKMIKKIGEKEVTFDDNEKIKFTKIDFKDIKEIIWW